MVLKFVKAAGKVALALPMAVVILIMLALGKDLENGGDLPREEDVAPNNDPS